MPGAEGAELCIADLLLRQVEGSRQCHPPLYLVGTTALFTPVAAFHEAAWRHEDQRTQQRTLDARGGRRWWCNWCGGQGCSCGLRRGRSRDMRRRRWCHIEIDGAQIQ